MTEYSKNNPFPAKLLERQLLNETGSTKQTYHLKLDLTHSRIAYKPGDAIGVYPSNPNLLVENILDAMKTTGKETVTDPRTSTVCSFKHFLLTKANLIRITLPMLKQFPDLAFLTHDSAKKERKAFIDNHDLLDLFLQYSSRKTSLQELLPYISPMLPRFYSIASSQGQTPNSVDLLVVTFQCEHGGKTRWGLGSYFLCREAKIGKTPIPVYHHPNAAFKIPEDPSRPILMIGPGTGVAPYRAFLQERILQKATGKNWLFFGERQRAYDFYYKDFLTTLEKKGFLRLDCAFSRDQQEKLYVQNLMHKHTTDIWEWINEGAFIYICGDARYMAKDVITKLHNIVAEKGKLSNDEAHCFIRNLRKNKRLLLDVY